MDGLLARGMVLFATPNVRRAGTHRGHLKTSCCNTFLSFPSEAAVFTASRLNASVLRIIGPGSSFITSGIGNLLAVDEFFVHPFHQQENSLGPCQTDCLTYFLEEKAEDDNDEDSRNKSLRHGVQVIFQTCRKVGVDGYADSESTKLLPSSLHVREAASVETLFLESSNNEGGAKVRVVAGQYESVSTSVQGNFVLLDIVMRPGSAAKIPVNPSHGLIVYILEGVGIMKRDVSVRPFYENEGHGMWFPPLIDNKLFGNTLHVTCHMWSSLRFLVLEIVMS